MQDSLTVEKKGIFEPPVKPKINKEMKNAVRQTERKEALKRQLIVLKREYKRDREAAQDLAKRSGDDAAMQKHLGDLQKEYDKNVARIKEEISSIALNKQEEKKILAEQLAARKAQYDKDIAVWNKVPEVSAEQLAKFKADYAALKADVNKRRGEAQEEYKAAIAKAKKQLDTSDRSPEAKTQYKVAVKYAKDRLHNTNLDLDEELRYAKEKEDKATKSSAQIFKMRKSAKTRAAIKRDTMLYVMLSFFIAWFVIFAYMPMYGLQIAFKDYTPFKGIWGSPWAPMNGFYHFYSFFTGPYIWRLIRNSFLINIYSIVFGFPMPIILAILLNEVRNKLFKTTVQTLSYMPHFISTVVVAGLVVQFLSPSTGLINFFYKWVTGSSEGIYFLTKPEYFRTIFVLMGIWQSTGFSSIIYTSALAGIDQELYEAARIDGAGRWKQLTHITLPGIMTTVAIMLIMRVGNVLNVGYETIILLYKPITYETADVISTYVYRIGMQDGNYSMSTAVGLFNGVISVIMVQTANAISRKTGDVGLW